MNRDLAYIEIAITAVRDILSYSESSKTFFAESTFLENKMLRHAVLMHLTVIGEYVGKISAETQNRFPSNIWKEAKFARNFYIHQYDGVEWPYVYDTITTVILPTLELLENVKQTLEKEAPYATDQ